MMKLIFVIVEGETEERFLRNVVFEHLIHRGIHLEAQRWTTNRKLGTSGGGKSFDLIENHLKRVISRYKNNDAVFITTMIDLYSFPKQGNSVYDREIDRLGDGKSKVIELQERLGNRINHRNFIPYVQLHEYETLILSQPESLSFFYPDKEREIKQLKDEISGIPPEEINQTPEGAPSKRIEKYIPIYKKQKTTAGVITAELIGLDFLRGACPHFNDWVTKIESI